MSDKKKLRARKSFAAEHAVRLYDQYFKPRADRIFPILLQTLETHNFTYDLIDRNLMYLADVLSCVTGRPREEMAGYIAEARNDLDLHVASGAADGTCIFGRRLGWYAIARALKPKLVVETGVERGHGALILCAALLKNAAENAPGRYIGTDINPSAGVLLRGKYATVGDILYGDSLASLKNLNQEIGLFINDSDHSAEYEYEEYCVIKPLLARSAIVLGYNAHVTDKLAQFSRETGRHFLFFREEPKDHWYYGAGIGFSFPGRSP